MMGHNVYLEGGGGVLNIVRGFFAVEKFAVRKKMVVSVWSNKARLGFFHLTANCPTTKKS